LVSGGRPFTAGCPRAARATSAPNPLPDPGNAARLLLDFPDRRRDNYRLISVTSVCAESSWNDAMPISVTCDECDKQLTVADRFAGKRVKCPKCEGPIDVPADEDEADRADPDDRPAPRKRSRPREEDERPRARKA